LKNNRSETILNYWHNLDSLWQVPVPNLFPIANKLQITSNLI
jgi:hypothetical protein